MNRLPSLFIGIFGVFLFAWVGLVALPYMQIGNLQPEVSEDTGELLPPGRSGLAEYGARVYAANGCMYCHSQQIRPDYAGYDLARGWGKRRTVPRDYIHEKPVFLGTMRTGPDLTNIGERQPSVSWHHQHLYDPQAMSPGSIMPPFRFLYEKREIGNRPLPDDAVAYPGDGPDSETHYLEPTYEAKALVEYLLSLKRGYPLEEAPIE